MIAETETVGLVQQFVERTGQLYSLPAVAAEVLRLTSEPQIDPRALRQCIESDPALAARLLRVVNSSLFGPTRPVTDLSQALTLLGIRPLKMLVLGFSLPKELFTGLEAEVLARYWRQTLVKAVAAREISERLWQVPGDEAFLAALVQDIGVLALIQQLGPAYERLLSRVQTSGGSLIDCELDTLGFDHLVLSARLLSHWGLPAGLCAAISVPPVQSRIEGLSGKERTLPSILHLADLVARMIDQPYGSALNELLTAGGQYCGLNYDRLQPIVADLQYKVAELAEVLSLQLADGLSYVDLLIAAQQRLANESVDAMAALATNQPDGELIALAAELQQRLSVASQRGGSQANSRSAVQRKVVTRVSSGCMSSQQPTIVHEPRGEKRLSSDQVLRAPLAAAIQRSRQSRTPLTLALFEIDNFSDLLVQGGPVAMTELAYALRYALADWTASTSEARLISDSRLAMVWEGCSRSEAIQRTRDCIATASDWARERFDLSADVTLSIGVATLEAAPKNYPAQELIDAAERCLSAARLSGGNTIKSIAF